MLLGTTMVCESGLFTASAGKQKMCVGGSGLESLMGILAGISLFQEFWLGAKIFLPARNSGYSGLFRQIPAYSGQEYCRNLLDSNSCRNMQEFPLLFRHIPASRNSGNIPAIFRPEFAGIFITWACTLSQPGSYLRYCFPGNDIAQTNRLSTHDYKH